MESPESSDINGKKVFFVHPNSVIQKEMVSELIRQEYEVLLVPESGQARKLFAQYPDCIAFLNLDEGLSEEEWEDFIRDVQGDPALKGVKLGILTYNPDPNLAEKYLMDFQLPCGYITISLKLAESTSIVLKVLEANEARGRRKYLRVHCDEKTKLNVQTAKGTIEGRVIDISSVGMACTLGDEVNWPVHTLLSSIQLKLKGALCLVNGVIMGSRPGSGADGPERVYVVLFDPKTPAVQKEKIRTFLQQTLQASIGV